MKITEMAQPAISMLRERISCGERGHSAACLLANHKQLDRVDGAILCKDHDIRGLKDRMSRDIMDNLDKVGISIAPATYNIAGLPPVHVSVNP